MDLAIFTWLCSDAGREVLAEAVASDLGDAARLRTLERLRRNATPEQAAAAYETALLRARAAAKFPGAALMYFTREGLEQSSGAQIAAYRAERYAARTPSAAHLADLCCGIGGDTLAFAGRRRVVAVDIDPLRLAMARANAVALGVAERVTFEQRDLDVDPPPPCDAIFFDPSRRSAGRRVFRLADYHPPVARVLDWRATTPAIGIKVAPGVDHDELAALGLNEIEFVSVGGELKEGLIWMGPLGDAGRRATLLRDGDEPVSLFLAAGQPAPVLRLAPPEAYLFEPDPAILRAGLVTLLGAQLGAAQLDRSIAYLTSDTPTFSPFGRVWRILEWMPFSLKRLQAQLRILDAGAVTVKKRGSPLDTDALARKLSGRGTRPLVVVLTIVNERPGALICEGPIVPNPL